jgi:hypothetical protein
MGKPWGHRDCWWPRHAGLPDAIDVINKIILGGQQALVVGLTWYQTPVSEPLVLVNEVVRKVAENAGVPYLDVLDPPWLTRSDAGRPKRTDGRGTIRDRR